MTQTVTVKQQDTITGILKRENNISNHEVNSWMNTIKMLNPHISNLDRIFPGENILIPETLNETISEGQIWGNAFNGVPRILKQSYTGGPQLFLTQEGDTIDSVAQYMFEGSKYRSMRASAKRALLLHNNPFLINHLHSNRIPGKGVVVITPVMMSEMDKTFWNIQRNNLKAQLNFMDKDLISMLQQTDPESPSFMEEITRGLVKKGASVGLSDVVTAGGSGYAATGEAALGRINTVMRDLYLEAIEALGKDVVHSKKPRDLARMQQFIKNNHNYKMLMHELKNFPKLLISKVKLPITNPTVNFAAARHFRRQFSLPFQASNNPAKYTESLAKQLNGKVKLLGKIGRGATWYVPAILGVYSVAQAPRELRMRTLFEQGFGILGGWAGTELGLGLGLGIASVLCLGPFGLFITAFVFATAGGIGAMVVGKAGGEMVYNTGSRIFHSAEDLVYEVLH